MDKNIAAILRNDTKTVGIKFFSDRNEGDEPNTQEYTYVTNLALTVDDLVIVKVIDRYKVCLVTRVDEDLQIEPNSDKEYKWVVAKVDLTEYALNVERNRTIEYTLGSAYQKQMRQSFAQSLLLNLPDEARGKIAGLLGE